MKLYYITRTYADSINVSNCAAFRNYSVELLKKRYEVVVVTPIYNAEEIDANNEIIRIPYNRKRTDAYFERVGIYEDYLMRWVKTAYAYLCKRITSKDILMATSGGEMGCIILASEIKNTVGCKMIVNFHDPVDGTFINGKMLATGFHVSRKKILWKYLRKADAIITCSDLYKKVLEEEKKETFPCIYNVYMGFRGKIEKIDSHNRSGIMHLVYAGTMSQTQGAERFIDIFSDLKNVEIVYIGNANEVIRQSVAKNENVKVVEPMPHDQYMKFIKDEADIGLVALNGVEFGACVPSKIFELINLEIPIFGLLPDGDAKDMINNGYGYACRGNDKAEAIDLLSKLMETDTYEKIKVNMRRDKEKWHMDRLFENVYEIIDKVVDSKDR